MPIDPTLVQGILSRGDPFIGGLIERYGICPLLNQEADPFDALVRIVISQQLSAKASATISRRLEAFTKRPFSPEEILELESSDFSSAGVSRSKTNTIKEVSKLFIETPSFSDRKDRDSEKLLSELLKIKGIGSWTIEVFQLFGLREIDIFPKNDAGLLRAIKIFYHVDSIDENELYVLTQRWIPYRSIAAWYLWKHLDENE